MRYNYEPPKVYTETKGITMECEHPVFFACTVYISGESGLGIIQQRYDERTKTTYWGPIDPWLVDDIYNQPGFRSLYESAAGPMEDGYFPTLTVRTVMWSLRMKPLKKEPWETVFDRKFV